MSTTPPIYVLDTSVFIQAHRQYYTFDICPGFWSSLLHYQKAGRIISIDRVRNEILKGDALEAWVRQKTQASLFASTVDPIITNDFSAMMKWVQGEAQFMNEAKAEFARVADGWVVAYAKSRNDYVVVTQEEWAPYVKKKVPLPNVCKKFNVPYINIFLMLKDLKVQFHFNTP